MGPWGLALYPFIRAAIGGPAVVGHGKRCRGESTRTFGKMRVRGDEADVRSAEARFRRRIAADTRRLDTGEPGRGEPPGQTARGRRRDRWHGLQLGRGHVGALAVQGDQRVATRSWDCARPTNGSPAVAPRACFLIDPDATVERRHHVELLDELRDGRDPGRRSQRLVRQADRLAVQGGEERLALLS
jgi:hypothetical protein